MRALVERGYAEPTQVQAAILSAPPDRDLLVSAQTGSGKTVAFGLAMAPTLLPDLERFVGKAAPRALIVAPTRELALQVARELTWLYAPTGARVVACVGGMDLRSQERALHQGAHIVVGTPGRLCDHLDRGGLTLTEVAAVVLDEADQMLDLGFREELERILGETPTTRRTLLFSATLPRGIVALAKKFQRDAVRLSTIDEAEPHHDIEYRAVLVAPRERERAIVNILRWVDARGALVFCNTRDGVTQLCGSLLERGFAVVPLSGELSQAERNRALQSLREGRARVCVATDVAARGLDLPDLGLVIHADPPRERETLLHRSGRTGRAGRKGVAVVIVPGPARRLVERILDDAGVEATWTPPPSAEKVRARDQERIVAELTALADDPAADDLAAAESLLETRPAAALVAALVRMHRGMLPAPEEISVVTERGGPRGDDGPRPARGPAGPRLWFEIDVGRFGNADPRWLLPLLCRRGQVTKAEIGTIRIGQRVTWFEVAADAADRFADAARRPDAKDKHRIVPAPDGPQLDGPPPRGPNRRPPPRR
ncbi:MAG: DEAD/DEAH box helicase [Kofleriaceae bacterium]